MPNRKRESYKWWAVYHPEEGPIIVRSVRSQVRNFPIRCDGDRIVRVTITVDEKKRKVKRGK